MSELTKQLDDTKKRKSQNEDLQKDAKQGKDNTVRLTKPGLSSTIPIIDCFLQEKRQRVLRELQEVKDRKNKLVTEMEKYKDLDPQALEEKRKRNFVT